MAFSHAQFAEYLLSREDWCEVLANAYKRWVAWSARQQRPEQFSGRFISQAQVHLAPALSGYRRAGQRSWIELFSPAIRSREDWITTINQAWAGAEQRTTSQEHIEGDQPVEPLDLAALRRILIQHFNLSEIQTLCFDLRIDYENLPGTTLDDKGRELIAYAQRDERMADLLAECRRQRATVDWPQLRPAPPPAAEAASPEELLAYALLITSWPQGQPTLPAHGAPSPDQPYSLLLTDQLRTGADPGGGEVSRPFTELLSQLAIDASSSDQESFVLLVSELGQAWLTVAEEPQRQFAQILRLITQFVRRQATISPLSSARANLFDALSALAPAIRYHFPASVDPLCRLVEAVVAALP